MKGKLLVARAASAMLLLSVVLIFPGCDGGPSAPSSTPSPASTSPTPPPVPDLSPLVGVWNVTVRLTGATGSGCIAETMRSQIGEPNPYLLSITPQGNGVAVTLKKGDRACAFTPTVDSSGFTTYGQGGYYTCEPWSLDFSCSDGTHHSIYTYGEDISGRVSGKEMSGEWDASWFEGLDSYGIEMKAHFTGSRQ